MYSGKKERWYSGEGLQGSEMSYLKKAIDFVEGAEGDWSKGDPDVTAMLHQFKEMTSKVAHQKVGDMTPSELINLIESACRMADAIEARLQELEDAEADSEVD